MPARKGCGRKPLSNVIKLKTGNPGRRPLKNEPKPPADLPVAPSHLDAYAMEEWDRIAVGLNVMGVLTVVDRSALAAYCGAYSRWRHAEEALQKRIIKAGGEPLAGLIDKTSNGNVIQNCLIGIANKAAGDMVRYAAEFGMTPSSRARLGVDPGSDKESKFKGLIGAGSGKR